MERTFYKSVVLPIDLIGAVDKIGFSNIKRQKAFHFIDLLVRDSIQEHGSMYALVPFSANLFREVFNSKYQEFLRPLLDTDIVQCDEKYSKDSGKSKFYRINPEIIQNVDTTAEQKVKYTYKYVQDLKEEKFLNGFETFYNSLDIPYDELYHAIDDHVYNIGEDGLKVNYSIEDGKLPILHDDGEINYEYRDRAIKKACKMGMELIQDGDKYYMDTIKDYLSGKKHRIMLSYTQSVKNMEQGNLYAKRNRTNQRLDHNFTTLPKILLEIIMQNNGLGEIDATNSQYAILGNIIKDVVHDGFVQDSTDGVLYDEVKEILGCDRDTAKTTMMQVVYSKPTTKSPEKEKIRERYPEMIAYVDDYKVKWDYKQLPIRMQKEEALIYVDGALDRLYGLGINCITKHDSVIFFEKDRETVKSVLDEVLKEKNYTLDLA
ncbi:hypothetical protein [Flagellimonas myxillae]|uniref:hypothetical protein n=1 Tax=Flagellimonas myxillae TaxID=2942214 RepID=UPI00201EC8BE|nr:hypothetical protein [Muricauda myxillae]MCL6264924.1 hypothetical protein [Muricauda myxillae]